MAETLTQDKTATQAPGVAGAAAKSQPDASAADKYAGEPVVIERLDLAYTFAADGTGGKTQTAVARIQSEAALRQFGVLNFGFSSASERVEIEYLRVRNAKGVVTETPANSALEMPAPVTQAAPFYSDLKQLQIPVRNLQTGDRLEYRVKYVRFKAEAEREFWGTESFEKDAVTLEQSLELRTPRDTYAKVWSPKYKAEESTTASERVWRWTSTQLKPTVGKEAEAAKEAEKHHVLSEDEQQDAEDGKYPDVAWTSFRSWEEVGQWYRGLEQDRVVPEATIKAKVAELTAGKTTEEERVKAVYSYVSSRIRYIGVAFGIGRYQPHMASEVLDNQYGDCKDKHTLLASMLTAMGLHPEPALIGAGVRFNEAIPSPAAFNHVITAVLLNGQTVWLDSTTEVAPYRVLNVVIRDKQALVIPESGAASVERTPVSLPFPAVQKFEAKGILGKDGTANSKLVWTLRGDDELVFRGLFHQTAANQQDDVVQKLSQNMGFGGTTSNAETSRANETDEPFQLRYDYKREKPGNDWDNLRITALLSPVYLPKPDEADPPVEAIQLGNPREESSTSSLKLPDGWTAVLPEAIHARSPYATLDETYRLEKGVLYAERKVQVLQKKVPVAEWKAYLKWTQAAQLGSELYVQLETKAGGATAAIGGTTMGTAVVSGTEPESEGPAKLIEAANQALNRHELDQARSLLDNAKKKSDAQPGLWGAYGYLEFQKGNLPETITDYQKEISLHPDAYGTYPALARVQSAFHQRNDAKETLRKWMEVQPENQQPPLMLISMLLADQDAGEAVRVAESALARMPEDAKKTEPLRLMLGQAQYKAGMGEKSRATFLALMQSTEDPGMMNSSAYELADEMDTPSADRSKTLALAEEKAKFALSKLEEESRTWTLDEEPRMLRSKSSLIAAAWDTVGWILFREGKTEEADGYIRAAWRNRSDLAVGEHLGEIAEANGKRAEALADYEEAVASSPSYDEMGVRKAPTPAQTKVSERAARLRKAGVKPPVIDAKARLQKARTVSLGAAKGLNGTAEYRLLLRAGKVVKAESIGNKELPGGPERLMQASLSDLWPHGSDAALVRNAALTCHGAICEMVLEP